MFQNSFCLSKIELGFRSGDIIYVLGAMDRDGFYYVSVTSTITIQWLDWIVLALTFAQKFKFHLF